MDSLGWSKYSMLLKWLECSKSSSALYMTTHLTSLHLRSILCFPVSFLDRMEMDGSSSTQKPQRAKQKISVPFFWEEKPGLRKKEWGQTTLSPPVPVYAAPSCLTQVASIPFVWEERPGKPLEHFGEPWPGGATPVELLVSTPGIRSNNPFIDNEKDHILDSSHEPCPRSNDNSSAFTLSSRANRLSFSGNSLGLCEGCDSDTESECENYSSSSSSNDTNAVNVSVLDLFFPLSSPEGGSPSKPCLLNGGSRACNPDHVGGNNSKKSSNLVVRRTTTLGELIMLSRRLSCARRNTIPSEEKNAPTDFMKKLFACF